MAEMIRPASDNRPATGESPARVDRAAESLKSNLSTSAHAFGDGMKHLAGDAVDRTKKGATNQLELGKSRAVEGLGSVATALRKTGESLREEDNDMLTGVLDSAAKSVDSVSGYIKDKSFTDVLVDMKDFARREPALFLGGALVVGLLGGRFLKSSTPAPKSGPSQRGNGNGSKATGGRGTSERNGQLPKLSAGSSGGEASSSGGEASGAQHQDRTSPKDASGQNKAGGSTARLDSPYAKPAAEATSSFDKK